MVHPVDFFVGQKLRNRRWMLGLTQQQLARLVGVRFQQIQKYESGINRISASRLWEIGDALDVSVAYFFDGYIADEDNTFSSEGRSPSASIMDRRETVELVRTYYAIDDHLRTPILDLLKSLSDQEEDQVA